MTKAAFLGNQLERPYVFAIAGGDDLVVKETVALACKQNLGKFITFGRDETLYQEFSSENVEFIAIQSDEEAAKYAAEATANGGADVLMKGFVPTATLLHQVLDESVDLKTEGLLSHLAVFDIPSYNKPVMITDCAMNIAPDYEAKKQITENAILAARLLGISQTKIIFLSAVEKVTAKIPSTVDAEKLKNYINNKYVEVKAEGPLAFDAAISKEAAFHKGIKSDLAGEADILVIPNIESGNILYKSLVYFAEAKVAGVIIGAKIPIVVSSRSDSAENKLASLFLAARMIRK